jgi:hydrogenase-4 component E
MVDFFETLSVLILISSFAVMASKRISTAVKSYQLQSALIALAVGIEGVDRLLHENTPDLLLMFILIAALKVVWIPWRLCATHTKMQAVAEKDFILNIPILVLISSMLVVFVHFAFSGIEGISGGPLYDRLVNSVSVVFIGMLFMISRKKAIGQIVGFLVIENGLFAAAMFVTGGMPIVVELGTLADVLTAVMVMGAMVFTINDRFDSTDIEKLNHLKG